MAGRLWKAAAFGFALGAATAPRLASAQDFSSRPITFVLPSSAGGPGEHSGRLISEKMTQVLGTQIPIEGAVAYVRSEIQFRGKVVRDDNVKVGSN